MRNSNTIDDLIPPFLSHANAPSHTESIVQILQFPNEFFQLPAQDKNNALG